MERVAPKPHPVLFVDDEADMIDTFVHNYQDAFEVLTARDGLAALDVLRARDVPVMVVDQRMPGMHGLEVVRRALEIRPDVVPIILTGFTNDQDLIDAINLQRIYRYIPKPWDPDELEHCIEGAIEKYYLVLENRRLATELTEANERLVTENAHLKAAETPRMLIGETPAMQRLLDEIRRVAAKDVTVLIEGETGTGKELVARSIHTASPRRERLFVAVNCAELSPDAAESRLFGHRRGSFTGAVDEHKGFFEVAHGGTLFLDEVGELLPALQGKLLRALQEREIVRFGDNKPRPVDVRVIAASNRRLDEEVAAGRFRSDLYYRLNVVPIVVPALRNRRDDVPVLAEHLLRIHAPKMRLPVPTLSASARSALAAYDFPGNVRDLENVMIRALVMTDPGMPITRADLPQLVPEPDEPPNGLPDIPVSEPGGLSDAIARFEREQIERALDLAGGNRTRAAGALKISKRWLLKKLEQYRGGDS